MGDGFVGTLGTCGQGLGGKNIFFVLGGKPCFEVPKVPGVGEFANLQMGKWANDRNAKTSGKKGGFMGTWQL